MARRWSVGERLRASLFVGGLTLGILFLVFLQFAIPYWIGPAGLVVVVFVDTAIYLELRHRRAVRRRAHAGKRAVGRSATPRKGPLKDEYVVTIGLLVFIVGFSIEGIGLQANPQSTTAFVLFLVGGVITMVAALMWWPYEWKYYYSMWTSESETYDTTDDH